MRQVDVILEKFPGPVTLYVSRRKKLLALVVCLAFTAFMLWLVNNPRERLLRPHWYDFVMAWVSLAFFGALTLRAVFLLAWPRSASLTLDANGFEIGYVLWRRRFAWHGVRAFRGDKWGAWYLPVKYEELDPDAGPRDPLARTRALPDHYGLPREDLVWLLSAWRERALAQWRPTSVPGVGAAARQSKL
ncbi:MAG TPA: hypothetical protein VHG27_10135 [Xanthobacteraceae bacterium]|nr:hypothetical protein [Xanthobacteraceae bacterium]